MEPNGFWENFDFRPAQPGSNSELETHDFHWSKLHLVFEFLEQNVIPANAQPVWSQLFKNLDQNHSF